MAAHIRKGDTVVVTKGKELGKRVKRQRHATVLESVEHRVRLGNRVAISLRLSRCAA